MRLKYKGYNSYWDEYWWANNKKEYAVTTNFYNQITVSEFEGEDWNSKRYKVSLGNLNSNTALKYLRQYLIDTKQLNLKEAS